MGLLNFSSFRKAAVDVVAKNDGNDPSALLAGADVTRAFTDTVAEVRKKFPEAEIALGGDEILIFFPAESNVSEESAVSKVVAAISSHG
ncbi:MAG: hypothetical protein QG650_1016, partial [Patescibacteria group bacterium]|nr:hypothetical protein [Patescibacteria group bacterium]